MMMMILLIERPIYWRCIRVVLLILIVTCFYDDEARDTFVLCVVVRYVTYWWPIPLYLWLLMCVWSIVACVQIIVYYDDDMYWSITFDPYTMIYYSDDDYYSPNPSIMYWLSIDVPSLPSLLTYSMMIFGDVMKLTIQWWRWPTCVTKWWWLVFGIYSLTKWWRIDPTMTLVLIFWWWWWYCRVVGKFCCVIVAYSASIIIVDHN